MRTWHTTLAAGIFTALTVIAESGQAQQVTVGNRFHTLSDSFFEQNSVSWSGNYRGFNFSFGGAAQATPVFGSPNAAAGLGVNFGIVGANGHINFALNFSQGDKGAAVTQAPSVTLSNGQAGYIADTSQTPFVVSVIPVVGGFPVAPTMPLADVEPDPIAPDQGRFDAQLSVPAGGIVAPQPAPNNPAPPQKKQLRAAEPIPAPGDPAEAAGQQLNAAQASTAGRTALSVAEAKRLHQQEEP